MKVIRARSAGFCRGVERAIKIARGLAAQGKRPVLTEGPLIHNRQMTELLEQEGIREWDRRAENLLPSGAPPGTAAALVVRAHGIAPERRRELQALGLPWHDATCPDVGKIAGLIRRHAKKGFATVIFGDPEHPEAIGLKGYAEGCGHVVKSAIEADHLPPLGEKVLLVAQSTMFTEDYQEIVRILAPKYPRLVVFDTICGATKARQQDVIGLAKSGAEAVVVIGGRHSANTLRLAELARRQKLPVYHVETAEELDLEAMRQFTTVGVTAGASTPEFLIAAVCRKLEGL